jgi:hypothetical protein
MSCVVLVGWLSNSAPPLLERAIRAYQRLDLAESRSELAPERRLPKRAKTLNAGELERIREAYAAGATTAELGRQFGVDRQTVQRKLRAMGVRMHGSSLTRNEVEEAARLYEAGNPVATVAAVLGRGESGVRNALIRADAPLRDTRGRRR